MRQDDHLIFEALQSKGVVVHIADHVVDEQEGTAEPGYYPFKTRIKQFDAKHVAHALIKHAYGKLDQDRVEAALQDVLDSMVVNPYGAKPGIIELTIDEFPTDGMVHQVEAKIVNKAEDAESYDAMTHLAKAANDIRDILTSNADDEARTEHIIKMAQMILGSPKDYDAAEYRKMLDGLIVLLNRFIVTPMN
jgi:glycosylphosphatidylinositol transamidase (GPIT) subunit GPI8